MSTHSTEYMWKRFIQFITESTFQVFFAAVFPPTPGDLPKNPKLILVFSTTGIGDALFDTAAIRSLRLAYPQARIVVCAHRKRMTVARHTPDVDEVVPYGKSPFLWIGLLLRFHRERPDLVILLRSNEEVVPLAYCINRKALFGGDWRAGNFKHLLSHSVTMPEGEHILRHGTVIAEAAGGIKQLPKMVYAPKPEELRGIQNRFQAWAQTPFLIFQTGGGRTLSWRNWPVDSYVRTIRWLAEICDLQVILTGGKDNEAAATAIEASCPWVINLCSKTTLEETAALLTRAVMLVSTDTGVMHLGIAVGCPTLALLHHSSPARGFGPTDLSDGHEVIELPLPELKSDRVHEPQQLHGEMEGIRDEDVRGAIRRILVRRGVKLSEVI
ncbi:MAG: glycosyltransferase family 9 protein [Verrucomicrobiota bacterium]